MQWIRAEAVATAACMREDAAIAAFREAIGAFVHEVT
jgi:hypothetical protein